MYAMDYMKEGIHTLAAFSEMIDVFDYIGSILEGSYSSKYYAGQANSKEASNDVASEILAKEDLVRNETQRYDDGSALETSGEIPNSTSISEFTAKQSDTDQHLQNYSLDKIQASNSSISPVAITEQKRLHDCNETDKVLNSSKQCDQTPFKIESDLSVRESEYDTKIDAYSNSALPIIPEENDSKLSLEENFNQYEVFTETCKYVSSVQSTNLSHNISSNSSSGENVHRNESNENAGNTNGIENGLSEKTSTPVDSIIRNEAHIELKTNGLVQKIDTSDSLELKKKLVTSSWDLVSIVKLLHNIVEPQPPKVHKSEQMLQTKVLLLSRGSFSKYSEGVYDIFVDDNNLTVQQGSETIISFSLSYAEFSLDTGDILRIDNKMGRTLYIQCSSKTECLELLGALQITAINCRQPECINLVHYPLKCYQNIIIIDLGSCSTRAGLLMDQPTLPTIFFPSVCATDKTTGVNEYGVEALQPSKRQNSTISFPIRPSVQIIKHNIDVEKVSGIFKKIFHQLRIDPENYTVHVCLPRSLSINAQNALVKVLLEELNVKAVSLAHQAILTMYAHNVSTGVVVDVGDRMDIMTVIDGFIVDGGVTRLPYGGQRLIHHMKHALAQKHISLSNEIDSFVVQYITENLSYIALDYEREQDLATSCPEMVRKSINLQSFAKDESCLQCATLEEARFKVPEGLFNPDLWGLDFPGIHKLVQKAIQAAGVDTRKKVAENIYVSGGVTLIPGFVDRLRKEVTKLNEPRITPKVFASEYRYHCTFIGACRFARMDVFPQVCVSKEEYRKNQQASLKKFALCI